MTSWFSGGRRPARRVPTSSSSISSVPSSAFPGFKKNAVSLSFTCVANSLRSKFVPKALLPRPWSGSQNSRNTCSWKPCLQSKSLLGDACWCWYSIALWTSQIKSAWLGYTCFSVVYAVPWLAHSPWTRSRMWPTPRLGVWVVSLKCKATSCPSLSGPLSNVNSQILGGQQV